MRSALDVDPTAWPCAMPERAARLAAWMPPAHTTVRVRISRPSERTTRSAVISVTFTPSSSSTPRLLERSFARTRAHGRRTARARPTRGRPGRSAPPRSSTSCKRCRDHPVEHVGERAGGLHAGGAGADDHEVQRALVDELRVAIGVLEHREQPRPESLGVVERVQRERVRVGTRGVEEVRPRRPSRARGSRRRT